jgi:protein dithiol oxidoreductase (disulfide-forming)
LPLTKTYYALEAINELERLHQPLFSAYHDKHVNFGTDAAIIDWVANQGVDRNKFSSAFNSFSVQNKALRAKQMTKAYGITGVPTVIVDGKYLTSASMTGSHESLLPVLDQLIVQARQERTVSKKK